MHRCQALEKCRKTCLEEALGKCSAQVSRTGEVQEDMLALGKCSAQVSGTGEVQENMS